MHSVALGGDGRVWVWGGNDFAQLGRSEIDESVDPLLIEPLDFVKTLTSGRNHVLVLEQGGAVRAWGANQAGQLGLGSVVGQVTPQLVTGLTGGVQSLAAGDSHSMALGSTGLVWTWGANDVGQLGDDSTAGDPLPAAIEIEGATAVSAGRDHAIIMTSDGRVFTWGLNSSGQLGVQAQGEFSPVPVQVMPVEQEQ
jgi:E3 ubiquitin-protein ligase HERC3